MAWVKRFVRPLCIFLPALFLVMSHNAEESPAIDNTTPEGAVLVLQAAYADRDVNAAVNAKDFRIEAELWLKENYPDRDTSTFIDDMAGVFEGNFRKDIQENGFPDFTGLATAFVKTHPESDTLSRVWVRYSDVNGKSFQQVLRVARTGKGWKVINLVKEETD